jgi:hypothetical protein
MTSYAILHADGSRETVADLSGHVRAGDRVRAEATTTADCDGATFALVSYEAPGPTFRRDTADQQTLFDHVVASPCCGTAPRLSLGPIAVPGCFFQVDLVLGQPLAHLGPAASTSFYGDQGRLVDMDNGGASACPTGAPPCPHGLAAARDEEGHAVLSWQRDLNASGYNVYRAQGSGMLLFLGHLGGAFTSLTDGASSSTGTYQYVVTATRGESESAGCEAIIVASEPFFPDALSAGVALAGAVGVALVVRRMR